MNLIQVSPPPSPIESESTRFLGAKLPQASPIVQHRWHRNTGCWAHNAHTHSRGHFNIIRYKAIIQAISLSLMICQHSLSVLFPKQILSCIANFRFGYLPSRKAHISPQLQSARPLRSHVRGKCWQEVKWRGRVSPFKPRMMEMQKVFWLRVKKLEFWSAPHKKKKFTELIFSLCFLTYLECVFCCATFEG